jgi:hypothetical protein
VIVTAADLTFNQGVRVRLPPTPLLESRKVGKRPIRQLRELDIVGSNPTLPTCSFRGGVMATCLALNQETSVRFPPPEHRLDTPTGRAARLKSERVWVRIPLQVNGSLSSWSSPECSSPCHGEGRGFKSHRGRYLFIRLQIAI